MPRILTIDDSSTIRTIISKQMIELGFEVDHAEDGEQGLVKIDQGPVDLILLDVTMPVMDGPTMLAKLREKGNRTPVIMLTSESKRSIVSGAVKLGIDDYILKPFKPDELRGKVLKALKLDGTATAATSVGAASPGPGETTPIGGARPAIDVLVVDDMENAHKKLRALIPAQISLQGCLNARDALQRCQEHVYRVVLIDLVIPDVNSVALMKQLKVLQPQAVMVALALRSTNDVAAECTTQGFSNLLFKPFEVSAVEEFLATHFEVEDLLSVAENVLECAAFTGKEDKLERYFSRLRGLCRDSFEKLASACYDDAILDLSKVPLHNQRVVRLLIDLKKESARLGLTFRLVGPATVKKLVTSTSDTADLPFFEDLVAARGAA